MTAIASKADTPPRPAGRKRRALARGFAGWICYHDVVFGTNISPAIPAGGKPIKVNPDLSWAYSLVNQVFNTRFHTVLYTAAYWTPLEDQTKPLMELTKK